MLEQLSAAGRLVGFMVLIAGLSFVLIQGCGVVADEAIFGDRRDPGRCPDRPGAVRVEVELGGYGDWDTCEYFDADGNPAGSLIAD